jgi:hypothetical protein
MQMGQLANHLGERDKGGKAEPSIAIPTVEDPLRSFVPKAPYPERLKAPKKNV